MASDNKDNNLCEICCKNKAVGEYPLCKDHTPSYPFVIRLAGMWTYVGEVEGEADGEYRHGRGIYSSLFGHYYNGEWKNNMRDGYGHSRFHVENYTEIYTGYFKKDKFSGEGTLQLGDIVCKGCWKKDGCKNARIKAGNGIEWHGQVYQGEFQRYVIDGRIPIGLGICVKSCLRVVGENIEMQTNYSNFRNSITSFSKSILSLSRALSVHIPLNDLVDIVLAYV